MLELFKYQDVGSRWLAERKYGLLADEMGLGKSAQLVTACDIVGADRFFLACPSVARANWLNEFEKFSNKKRKIKVYYDGMQEPPEEDESVIISYDLLPKYKYKGRFGAMILDEFHMLKNPEAKRTKAALGKTGCVHQSDRIWVATGTPMPNNASELWVLLYLFGKTKLGYDVFIERYCTTFFAHGKKRVTGTKKHMIPELHTLISSVMLRRMKDEVMKDLPKLSWHDMVCEPGEVDIKNDLSLYPRYELNVENGKELMMREVARERHILNEMYDRVQPPTVGPTGDQIGKFENITSQVATNFQTLRRYTGLAKVDMAAHVISQFIDTGREEKLVVFAYHLSVIENLKEKIKKYKPVIVTGGTPGKRRQDQVDKFYDNPKCKVFLGQITAAGTAITLTNAKVAIFVEQDWVPANNAQAAMRIHRLGQTEKCTILNLVLDCPVDRRVAAANKRKIKEILGVLAGVPVSQSERTEELRPPKHIPVTREFNGRTITRDEMIENKKKRKSK